MQAYCLALSLRLSVPAVKKRNPSLRCTFPFKANNIPNDAYLQHTLGKGPAEEIKLWFSPALAPYIKTQHLHHTQKAVHDNEEGLVITLKLVPNPELTQLLLSYCADIKVLKPESLRVRMVEMMEKGWRLNKGDDLFNLN